MRTHLTLLLSLLLLSTGPTPADAPAEPALPNDTRAAAGRLAHGVLRVRLEAREARWYPETAKGAGVPVFAFAEAGKSRSLQAGIVRIRSLRCRHDSCL